MQNAFQAQQLLPLTLHQAADGDAGPLAHNVGDFIFRHGIVNHGIVAGVLFRRGLGVLELLFQRGQIGVFQLGGLLIFQIGLSPLNFAVHLLNLSFELLDAVHAALLRLPAGLHGVELLLLVRQILFQLLQTVSGQLVVLLLQRHFLNFLLHDPAAQVIQLRGHGVDLRADHGAGLIHQVNGLVRQEPVGDIPVRQRGGGHQGVVVNPHAVIDFVALLQAPEDRDRVLHRGLIHLNRLEPALKRGVLFNILAVFVQRGGADAVQLAPGQHGLEQVAGVHAALGFSGAHDGVQLIDKEDDLSL